MNFEYQAEFWIGFELTHKKSQPNINLCVATLWDIRVLLISGNCRLVS